MDLDTFLKEHVLCSSQQRYFIHFTDRKNLVSIKAHGLLSMKQLRQRKINILAPGGNQWSQEQDAAVGMDKYVHLCFKTGHPMVKRAQDDGNITDLVYLKIKPEIIKVEGVKITGDVSNKSGVTVKTAAEMLDQLDLEVLYRRTDWKQPEVLERLKAAEKCELLIPSHVPIGYIINPDG